MYLPRSLTQRLRQLVKVFPIVVLSGARQVGKSTLLRKVLSSWDQVVFDPAIDIENARGDPDLFLDNHPPPLVLDEIQYAPEVAAALKRRIDRDRAAGQYLLTGSQQWGVLKAMSESLAGRAAFLDLEGFSLAEIARSARRQTWLARWLESPQEFLQHKHRRLRPRWKRTLFEQIWRGWLPPTQWLPRATVADFFAGYQRTYIERDARLLGDVADWQLFGRFLRLAAALTAQEINFSELGRELGLTPQTSKRWLGILRATFQWFEVPAYHGNAVKRISAKPKGFLADTGLACFAQAIAAPAVLGGHPSWGPLFETAVAGEIRKQCALLSPPPHVFHWRTHAGAEVDLLLEWNGTFFPIEVKATSHPGAGDTRGLQSFRATYPRLKVAKGLVIAPTETIYPLTEFDVALPWDLA